MEQIILGFPIWYWTMILGILMGAVFQFTHDYRHVEELAKSKRKNRRRSQHGLIFLMPFNGRIINFHTNKNPPKKYFWRWPKVHPGGRPPERLDDEARRLILDDGRSPREAWEILKPKYIEHEIEKAKNPEKAQLELKDQFALDLLFENYSKRIRRKLYKTHDE